ncbi:MAG: DUF1552 domain-containing protein [Deltaproteobacteria bacterium]|nr:DUF1552 domain-containing protein [Deltaproteobacteria bacterium]
MSQPIVRRDLLRMAGLSTMALPLGALCQSARAAAAFPKRLVIVTSANGTSMQHFWPTTGVTGSRILEPLAPHASKLVVMRGIDAESAHKAPVPPDHDPDYRNLLTGWQAVPQGTDYVIAGISIDQHIANAVGRQTKLASWHLGGGSRLHSRGFNQPIVSDENPKAAVDRLFGDLAIGASELTKQRRERAAVMDVVANRMKRLRCQLGAADQQKLDAHFEAVNDVRLRTQLVLPAACKAPAVAKDMDYPTTIRTFMDLTVAALACDATRVVTVDLDNSHTQHGFIDYPGLDVPYHAGIAHDGSVDGFKKVAEIERWVAAQFAYLLSRMDGVKEGDKTLLDNSVVVWLKEQSNGSTHARRDYPVVLAGGGAGAIRTGRTLHAQGKPHSGLLISLANAMDVPTKTFGDPQFSNGPLPGL